MYLPINSFYSGILSFDTEARSQAREARSENSDLRERFDRLSLFAMAVWTLARDQLGLTEEQLLERVQNLDLSDGKLDGKVARGVSECPKCKRSISARHARCIYCGRPRDTLANP